MKRFIITITLLITLVGSVFATDWKSVGTYENEKTGVYAVYYDADASSPFENEDFTYLSYLKDKYKKVEVTIFDADGTESGWFVYNVRTNKSFSTLEIYTNYVIEDHINKDGSVTEYVCYR